MLKTIIISLILISIIGIYYLYLYIKKINGIPRTLFPMKQYIDFPHYKYEDHIPKVFHRTHLNEELINEFKIVEDKIKENNKDYQIINYTEEDVIKFIKEYYNDRILKAYNSIDKKFGAAKADLFRYLVIYAKGGIYVDIKSGPAKNIDKLLKDAKNNILVSSEKESLNAFWMFNFPKGEMINWVIISPKGHPVLRDIIERCISNIEYDYSGKENYFGNRGVIFMTGPMLFTHSISHSKNKNIKYLKPNFDEHFDKYLTKYEKSKLKKYGATDYFNEKGPIIKYKQSFNHS